LDLSARGGSLVKPNQLSLFKTKTRKKKLFRVVLVHRDPFIGYVLARSGEQYRTAYTRAVSKARAARNAIVRNPGYKAIIVSEA